MLLSAMDKQGWLHGIQLAQDSHVMAPPAHRQQQQLMVDFFIWQTIDSILLFLPRAIYPVPQLHVGYCPLFHFDGDALTRSTAV